MLLREPSTTHSDRYALGLVAFNAITLRDGKTEGERFEDPLGLPVHDADANLVYGWLGDAIRGFVPRPVGLRQSLMCLGDLSLRRLPCHSHPLSRAVAGWKTRHRGLRSTNSTMRCMHRPAARPLPR